MVVETTLTVSVDEAPIRPRLVKLRRPDGYILAYGGYVVRKVWFKGGHDKIVEPAEPQPFLHGMAEQYVANERKAAYWVRRGVEKRIGAKNGNRLRLWLLPLFPEQARRGEWRKEIP